MELNRKESVKISASDFPTSYFRKPESHLRSLEHYLKINNREYNIEGQECTIFVHDKLDAMKIGLDFHLTSVEYFNGLKFERLNLKADQKRGRPRNIVIDNVSGKGMTIGQFKTKARNEVRHSALSKSEIIKRKILSKAKLEKAIAEEKITPIMRGGAIYFDRSELAKLFLS
jgi:hypothetical protein